jgi:hypothetical protein
MFGVRKRRRAMTMAPLDHAVLRPSMAVAVHLIPLGPIRWLSSRRRICSIMRAERIGLPLGDSRLLARIERLTRAVRQARTKPKRQQTKPRTRFAAGPGFRS